MKRMSQGTALLGITGIAPQPRAAITEASAGESRFVIHGVPWHAYVALRDTLDSHSGLRLTYLRGALELMSPLGPHEDCKTIIARLLEAWAEERDVDLNGRGGQTFRKEAGERGLEPDECYAVGLFGEIPDLAIEVVMSNPLVDKLEVYAGLGVPEVWVYRSGVLQVHRLVGHTYETRDRSELLPGLDVAHLAGFIGLGKSQTATVKAYRRSLGELP